jgi:hypothetical protein
MLFAGDTIEQISQPGVEVDLSEDRHSQQRYHLRLCEDLFALKRSLNVIRIVQSKGRKGRNVCCRRRCSGCFLSTADTWLRKGDLSDGASQPAPLAPPLAHPT